MLDETEEPSRDDTSQDNKTNLATGPIPLPLGDVSHEVLHNAFSHIE